MIRRQRFSRSVNSSATQKTKTPHSYITGFVKGAHNMSPTTECMLEDGHEGQKHTRFTINTFESVRKEGIGLGLSEHEHKFSQVSDVFGQGDSGQSFNTYPFGDYFKSYIEKQRMRIISKKYKCKLQQQKEQFESWKKAQEVSKVRQRMRESLSSSLAGNFAKKNKEASNLRQKFQDLKAMWNKNKRESLERTRSRHDQVMNQEVRASQKKKALQDFRKQLSLSNLQQKINHYQKQTKDVESCLNRLVKRKFLSTGKNRICDKIPDKV